MDEIEVRNPISSLALNNPKMTGQSKIMA